MGRPRHGDEPRDGRDRPPRVRTREVERTGRAERFGVHPAAICQGRAPAALAELPDPDRVVIGGGGPDRRAILQVVLERLRPAGVVVIPLATLEALAELRPLLEQGRLKVRVGQVQAWRGASLAEGTRLAPVNPVLVLQGKR
mgnify:CR=1 FL=1